MSDLAIRVDGIHKQYRLGAQRGGYRTFRETIMDNVYAPFRAVSRLASGKPAVDRETSVLWALKDVSFEIRRGEVTGIIGGNGAGKSTLLKILSRITEPTMGYADIYGRVGSLLEVGTGFHYELTGRENIFLSGAILGMKRHDISRKFDEIVAFAEVSRFVDTQIKFYSSGMQVRLGFAVAAHMEPDILIVDEALAVGDYAFQQKSLGKLGDVAGQGRTVLFVSHSMHAVQRLCGRGIILRQGHVVMDAPIDQAVQSYLSMQMDSQGERLWEDLASAPGDAAVRVSSIRTRNSEGVVSAQFDVRDAVQLEVEYQVLEADHQLCVHLEFVGPTGVLFHSFDDYVDAAWGTQPPKRVGTYRSTCQIPGDLLSNGTVTVNLRIFEPPSKFKVSCHVREPSVFQFTVRDNLNPGGVRRNYPYEWGNSAIRPRLTWKTTLIDKAGEGSAYAS